MFLGHALFAFAVAALVAQRRGWTARGALTVGAVAGAFGALPDVDVAYALVGLAEWQVADGALGASTAFWDASRAVHRSVTHSVVVGAVAAPAFGLLAVRRSDRARVARAFGGLLLTGLVALALVVDGALAAFVTVLFAVGGALAVGTTVRLTSLSPATIALAALWGLWSHPWGDLVTGSPPDWAFPFESPLFASRVVLHPDPTVHLLAAFAIELAAVWLAAVAVCRLTDRSLIAVVDRRAAVGATYGVAALAVTPPTLELSYHFVFSILGVGLLCGAVRTVPSPTLGLPSRTPSSTVLLETGLTALAAVTIALATYAAVYLLAVTPT
ncbi:hydrolase [Natronococcus sp. JC468]|uniref:metal-dependent hydrolase n=1 Tax=Natronococcus sp. JC468 TaxID=1961921 RepID=UPI00143ADBA5|nr:metal-dependent hydrolase [Natronococcus sp. JC468]NKE37647.1 hydrolase [Natronococcus sp. JC468]